MIKGKKIVKEVTSINDKIISMIDNKKNKFGSGGITTKVGCCKNLHEFRKPYVYCKW